MMLLAAWAVTVAASLALGFYLGCRMTADADEMHFRVLRELRRNREEYERMEIRPPFTPKKSYGSRQDPR